eukprot:scaffold770_cov255-Pinguiococcus_pyrenoidosus.AAC.69
MAIEHPSGELVHRRWGLEVQIGKHADDVLGRLLEVELARAIQEGVALPEDHSVRLDQRHVADGAEQRRILRYVDDGVNEIRRLVRVRDRDGEVRQAREAGEGGAGRNLPRVRHSHLELVGHEQSTGLLREHADGFQRVPVEHRVRSRQGREVFVADQELRREDVPVLGIFGNAQRLKEVEGGGIVPVQHVDRDGCDRLRELAIQDANVDAEAGILLEVHFDAVDQEDLARRLVDVKDVRRGPEPIIADDLPFKRLILVQIRHGQHLAGDRAAAGPRPVQLRPGDAFDDFHHRVADREAGGIVHVCHVDDDVVDVDLRGIARVGHLDGQVERAVVHEAQAAPSDEDGAGTEPDVEPALAVSVDDGEAELVEGVRVRRRDGIAHDGVHDRPLLDRPILLSDVQHGAIVRVRDGDGDFAGVPREDGLAHVDCEGQVLVRTAFEVQSGTIQLDDTVARHVEQQILAHAAESGAAVAVHVGPVAIGVQSASLDRDAVDDVRGVAVGLSRGPAVVDDVDVAVVDLELPGDILVGDAQEDQGAVRLAPRRQAVREAQDVQVFQVVVGNDEVAPVALAV